MRPLTAALLSACILAPASVLAPVSVLANDAPPQPSTNKFKSMDDKGLYLRLDTGAGFSGSTNTSGTSPIVDVGVGYRLNRHLRGDVTLGYNSGYQINSLSAVNPNTGNTISVGKADYDSTAVMANVYYDIVKLKRFTPYVGGGLGMSFTSVKAPTLFINGASVGSGQSSNATDLAWQLALGTGVQITKTISLDIGYRYVYMGSSSQVHDFTPYGESATMSVSGNLYAHVLQAGLRYRF